MTVINVARQNLELDDARRDAARTAVFGMVDGASEGDRKAWRGFWRRLFRMEAGEMCRVEVVIPRNSRFHRKFFALITLGFEAWEPCRVRKTYRGRPVAKNFERFRSDIIIQAGYYEQTFDLQGRMRIEAQSISFAAMEDPEFEQLYSAVATVLLERVLTTYKGRVELDGVIDRIVGFL